jgi:aminoglycoside phosphotransferase (APT) family kinase protein
VIRLSQQQDPFSEHVVHARLVDFLTRQNGAPTAVEKLKRFSVGFSWLTYGFDASWQDASGLHKKPLILRIGPPNGIFAPYRSSPEFYALQSLQQTGVPVPGVYWFSDASDLFGAPFFICERVSGEAPVPWVAPDQDFSDAERSALAEQFVGALAALHRFEWRGTPIEAACAAVDERNAALKQIEFWEELLERSGVRRFPAVAWALAWLRANQPVAPKVSIIHGDYRIGNFLEQDGRITSILDWELVHLGDPHEDLGFVCLRTFRGGTPYMCRLISREDLYRRYSELSGFEVDPAAVHYYEVFNNFKLVAIHAAAAGCFEAGQFNDLRMPAMGAQMPRLLLQLEKMIEGLA